MLKFKRSSSEPSGSRETQRSRLQSIQSKTLLKLLPAMLPMLLTVYVGYRSSAHMALQSGERLSSLIAQNGAASMNDLLEGAKTTFADWIREDIYGMSIEFDTTRELGSRLVELLAVTDEMNLLVLCNAEGKILEAAVDGGDGSALKGRAVAEARRTVSDGRYAVQFVESDLLPAAGLGYQSTYAFCYPTRDTSGNPNGSLVGYVSWDAVRAQIEQANGALIDNGFPDALTVFLDGRNRAVLAGSDPAIDSSKLKLGSELSDWLGEAENRGHILPFEVMGSNRYVTFAPIHDAAILAADEVSDGATSSYCLTSFIPEANIFAETRRAMGISLLLAVGGAAMLIALIWFAGGNIAKPIRHTVDLVKDIAEGEGDLTRRLQIDNKDELGELAHWFNTFVEKLQGIISNVGQTTQSLNSSAEELTATASSMTQTADTTSSQANLVANASEQVDRSVQVVAAATEEMSASIREIAQNASRAAKVASTGVEVADTANTTIAKLGESSAEIDNVIKVITSIAEQTNLLALNATIESASAGEAGKGFAVVANEVKELAKETANATEDISRKIETIQADTRSAVEAIAQIGAIVTEISDLQTAIASSVEEQTATTEEMGRSGAEAAQGSTEIAKNISNVADGARSTTEGAKHSQEGANHVARIAEELQSMIGQFKY